MTPIKGDGDRIFRDQYVAKNSPALFLAMQACKFNLTVLECSLGGMSYDSDFAEAQANIVAALNAAIATVTAATPACPRSPAS